MPPIFRCHVFPVCFEAAIRIGVLNSCLFYVGTVFSAIWRPCSMSFTLSSFYPLILVTLGYISHRCRLSRRWRVWTGVLPQTHRSPVLGYADFTSSIASSVIISNSLFDRRLMCTPWKCRSVSVLGTLRWGMDARTGNMLIFLLAMHVAHSGEPINGKHSLRHLFSVEGLCRLRCRQIHVVMGRHPHVLKTAPHRHPGKSLHTCWNMDYGPSVPITL